MEQKVYVTTTGRPLFPNLYIILVGNAGTGKSKAIDSAALFVRKVPDITIAPTSMTMASMIDHLVEAKKTLIERVGSVREYNSMYIMADELSAFMHEYSNELIAGLTKFFDCSHYEQARRTKDIHVVLRNPQISILSGSTPMNLVKFIPEHAWEQGFTSRVILIYSNDRPIIDIFKTPEKKLPDDMVADYAKIAALRGQFGWTQDYADLMWKWKSTGFKPEPDHPKLTHYNSRRFSHVLKLSMVANVDRGDSLHLDRSDFNQAMEWLLEAEQHMPYIFQGGKSSPDNKAIEEIMYFIKKSAGPHGIHQSKIMNYARTHMDYAHSVSTALLLMEQSGLIVPTEVDNFGLKTYKMGVFN